MTNRQRRAKIRSDFVDEEPLTAADLRKWAEYLKSQAPQPLQTPHGAWYVAYYNCDIICFVDCAKRTFRPATDEDRACGIVGYAVAAEPGEEDVAIYDPCGALDKEEEQNE